MEEKPQSESITTEQDKKTYIKPAIIYLAPLEIMADVCSGIPGDKDSTCSLPAS